MKMTNITNSTEMEFIKQNLPDDICELFFSGIFWYCASAEKFTKGKSIGLPTTVGVGKTKEQAIADMKFGLYG